MCSYSVRNFGLCQEKETGMAHALHLSCVLLLCQEFWPLSGKRNRHGPCTALELCVATLSGILASACQEKETGMTHALHLSCVLLLCQEFWPLSGKRNRHGPCTAPELCVATLSGILASVRKKKQAWPMHCT